MVAVFGSATRRIVTPLLMAAVLAGCGGAVASRDQAPSAPAMRWDHVEDGALWTQATLDALNSHGAALLDIVPADFETWCPDYPESDPEERALFWTGMISALAKHESTWNEKAVGGGGLWFGLVQIAPATARGYKCEVGSGAALQDGVANLRCGVRIMAHTVARDGVVSQGMRGVAADWGPFHSRAKRTDMIEWVSSQSYCQVSERGLFARLGGS